MNTLRIRGDRPTEVDCLILGGGITGAGVARDAAMRGFSTMLVDTHDFASGTSHVTSKLIHGGLRYLEHAQFRLVYEGIVERDRLLNCLAPNLVSPLRFVIPHESGQLGKWLITVVGLQLYGFIERCRAGRRSLPMSGSLLARLYPNLLRHPFGVCYWDAQANDARLVISALRTCAQAGAHLRNHAQIVAVDFDGDHWRVVLTRGDRSATEEIHAATLVNATGPWSPLTAKTLHGKTLDLMWIKGSHLLLNRRASFGNDAIIIRSTRDRRPLWVIPWHTKLIVGTTETHYKGDLRNIRPSEGEVEDLFESFQHYFPGLEMTTEDISGAYAGVRPIVRQDRDSANELSRKHEITVDRERNLVTITGGKLTTFRAMAEKSVDRIAELLGRNEIPTGVRQRLRIQCLWPATPQAKRDSIRSDVLRLGSGVVSTGSAVEHWINVYGDDALVIAAKVAKDESLGELLFEGLPYCLAELIYLCENEWVEHLIDLVKRRTSIYFLAGRTTLDVLEAVIPQIASTMGWDDARAKDELSAVQAEFDADHDAISRYAARSNTSEVAACA